MVVTNTCQIKTPFFLFTKEPNTRETKEPEYWLQGSAYLWSCNDGVTEVCFCPTLKWILDAGILNSARLTD